MTNHGCIGRLAISVAIIVMSWEGSINAAIAVNVNIIASEPRPMSCLRINCISITCAWNFYSWVKPNDASSVRSVIYISISLVPGSSSCKGKNGLTILCSDNCKGLSLVVTFIMEFVHIKVIL